jgi:hypothetical protein
MESSSDDDGGAATTMLTKALLLCCVLLPFSVYKSSPTTKNFQTVPAQQQTGSPPGTSNKPEKKGNKKKNFISRSTMAPTRAPEMCYTLYRMKACRFLSLLWVNMFCVAKQAKLWDSLQIASQIELCNHSYSHAHSRYESYYAQPDSVVADFKRTHDSLDLNNTIARTPGRNIWRIDTLQFTDLKRSAVAADSLQKAGFKLMGWTLNGISIIRRCAW